MSFSLISHSITDVEGVQLFAYHGNVNKKIYGTEPGDYHGETRRKFHADWCDCDQWHYYTDRYHLRTGDILHFWIHVQHGQLGYRYDFGSLTYPDDFTNQTIASSILEASVIAQSLEAPPATTTEPISNGGCQPSITTVNNQTVPCKYQLLFEDHFDSFSANKWHHVNKVSGDVSSSQGFQNGAMLLMLSLSF